MLLYTFKGFKGKTIKSLALTGGGGEFIVLLRRLRHSPSICLQNKRKFLITMNVLPLLAPQQLVHLQEVHVVAEVLAFSLCVLAVVGLEENCNDL